MVETKDALETSRNKVIPILERIIKYSSIIQPFVDLSLILEVPSLGILLLFIFSFFLSFNGSIS